MLQNYCMGKNSTIIFIVLFIALILLGAGYILYSQKGTDNVPFVVGEKPPIQTPQTNSIPKDWKTYENREFGFAFDYPGNWDLEMKKVDYKAREPYLYYQINLWAPDQSNKESRNAEGNTPRLQISFDNDKEYNTKEKFAEELKTYEGISKIKLLNGLIAYHDKTSPIEDVVTVFNNIRVVFKAQFQYPLNMNIINTFRVLPRE